MIAAWIKSIVVFVLFSSLVFFLLPDEKYRKYMQTAVGCVMAILVITPIVQAGGVSDVMSFEYYKEQWGASVSEDDRSYYVDVMEQMVAAYIEATWGVPAQVTIRASESYEIIRMEVSVQEEVGQALLAELRQGLSSAYGCSEDTVSVKKDVYEN